MSDYQALMLMLAFATFIVALLTFICKHRITTRICFQLQVSYTDYNKFS